jgi:uncharacterized SAM-binding protein YcdF (DUF218 family)
MTSGIRSIGLAKGGGQSGGILVNLVVLLFLVVFFLALYFARHPIMRFVAETWVVDEPAPRADAILLLGDDNFYADRATHAAELFRHGAAPVIVASGRRLRPNAGVVELMEHDLTERGVPKDKIVACVHDADNTREEAVALARLSIAQHWKSVIIVTSSYHARRARYIFARVFPASISVSVAGARDGDFDPEKWWESRKSVKLFSREVIGLAVSWWELRGKNAAQQGETAATPVLRSEQAQVDQNGTIPGQNTCLSLYFT